MNAEYMWLDMTDQCKITSLRWFGNTEAMNGNYILNKYTMKELINQEKMNNQGSYEWVKLM